MLNSLGRCIARTRRLAVYCAAAMITLLAVPSMHAASARTLSQGATAIVGQVTDARTSQGIVGVTVQIDGGRLVAVTGEDGRFRIPNVSPGEHALSARRIGYASFRQTVTVAADRATTANFSLQVSVTSLDEVVVTGTAGGEQRRSIGNAVTTIYAREAMSKSAAQSVSSLIGARAPGGLHRGLFGKRAWSRYARQRTDAAGGVLPGEGGARPHRLQHAQLSPPVRDRNRQSIHNS